VDSKLLGDGKDYDSPLIPILLWHRVQVPELSWWLMNPENRQERIDELITWCKENCQQRWEKILNNFFFESKADAALFSMFV